MKTASRKNTNLALKLVFLAFGTALLLCASARAATDSWTGAASVNWGDNNWTGGNAVPLTGDTLIFGTTDTSGPTLTDNLMTPGTFTLPGIIFAAGAPAFTINPATAGTNGFTLSGSIANLSTNLQTINDAIILSNAGVNLISTTAGGGNITLGGTVTGSGTMTVTGGGQVTLSTAANTFGGGNIALIIDSGTAAGAAAGVFGSGTIQIGDANTGASNATLLVTGAVTITNAIATTSSPVSGALAINATNAGTTTFSGSMVLNDNLNVTDAGTLAITGNYTGSGTIIINLASSTSKTTSAGTIGNSGGWTGGLVINTGSYLSGGSNPLSATTTVGIGANGSFYNSNSVNVVAGFVNGGGGGGIIALDRAVIIAGVGSYTFGGNIENNIIPENTSLTKDGTGTQTFSGSNTINTILLNAGTLNFENPNSAATTGASNNYSLSGVTANALNITVGTGNAWVVTGTLGGSPSTVVTGSSATLQFTGNYLVGVVGTAVITVKGGNTTSTSQGTLSMVDGQINTLTIQTTAGASSTVLTLNSDSILAMEVGNNLSDQIILNSGSSKASFSTTGTLNVTGLGGFTGGGSQVLTLVTGTASAVSALPVLQTFGNLSGYSSAVLSQGSPNGANSSLILTLSAPNATPATAYWNGGLGSGGNGTWTTFTGGVTNNSNWSSSSSSFVDTHQAPGSTTNVLFNEAGAANTTTTLGGNIIINSLEFTSSASGASDATIQGNNTLTILATGTNFEGVSGTGLTVDAGAGTEHISSGVVLGSNQTWMVNNSQSNPLTVSGTISGAQALTLGGSGELLLSGSNSYTGNTTVSNGALMVTGTLYNGSSPGVVSVSGTGAGSTLLGGTGLINAAVSVGGGTGNQIITGGSQTSVGTLTLAGGLTINSGGIVYFNSVATNTSANFINITGANNLTINGGTFEVPSEAVGTYQLIGDAGGAISGTANITLYTLAGAPVASNYGLIITGGTLELSVATSTMAQPTLSVGNLRVIMGQSGTLAGIVGNAAGGATLTGTLADNSPGGQSAGSGTLNISSFPTNPVTVAAGSTSPYTAVINNVGSVTGTNIVNLIVTDGYNSNPTTATVSGTVAVLQNRTVSVAPVSFGVVHSGSYSQGITLTTTGDDNDNTRVMVGDSSTPDANGVTVTGGNTSTLFNGASVTDSRTIGANLSAGTANGTITLVTTGEGLTGESDINVQVVYTGTAFSGHASWSSNAPTGGSWATNANWGDTNSNNLGGIGAPGLSGTYSIGDQAVFDDVAGESAGTTISLNGASPTLGGITFNSTGTIYTIAPGTGGTITLQSGATIAVNAGTGVVSAQLTGTGGGWNLSSSGGAGILVLSNASNNFTGGITINSGVLEAGAANVLNNQNVTFGSNVAAGTMLVLGGFNTTVAALNTNAGTVGSPVIENLSATPAELITTASGTYAGVIQDGAGGGAFSLEVNGGVLTLTGNNTYSGSTDLNAGELSVGSANAIADTASIVFNGGTYQYTAANTTDYSAIFSTANGEKYAFDTNGQNVALGTVLAGSTSTLTKNGTGILTLSVSPTYGGATTINLGVLQTPNANLLSTSTTLTLNIPNGASTPGGVWQSFISAGNTTLNITLGTAAGDVNWAGGGFAAISSVAGSGTLTINANAGGVLTWGSGNFSGGGGDAITFGSTTSNDQVNLTNSINFATTDSFQQMIIVNGTNTGDSALISGQLTQIADSPTVNPTEASGLKKNGLGMLILSNVTNNFAGQIFVEQGSLVAAGNANAQGVGGVFGTGTGSPNGTSTTPAAAFNITMGDGNTIANSNPSLYIQGAFLVANNITAVNEGVGNNIYSIGGLTDATGTFSGTINVQTLAANNNTFDVTQVATTGADALVISGEIVSNNGAGESVNFANAGAVDVTGTIAGTNFQLIQSGPGTTTLTGVNTYTGSTIISAGVLQLGNGTSGSDGTIASSLNIQDNASLVYDRFAANTYSGSISGNGTVTILGSGTQTLSGSNSYLGNTTIEQGKLVAANTLGSATGLGTTNVAPNQGAIATLGGNGIISGSVATAAASGANIAHIAPGVNSSGANGNFGGIGTLTLNGGLTIGNGTNLDFDLGTSSDLIAVTNGLSLGTGVVLNINQAAGFGAGTYTLLTYTGALTGDDSTWTATNVPGADTVSFASGGGTVTVTIAVNNNSTLVITPTPTAPSYISLGSVLVGSTPGSTVVTGSNGGTTGTGTYALAATGSASVSPSSTTLAPSGATGITVGAANPIGGNSGNNVVIGSISATNSANSSGSLAPVNVTANVYQVTSLSTSLGATTGTSAVLNLTNAASTDGGQRAGVTINGWSTNNSNFVVGTDNSGVVGTANGSDVTQDVGTVTLASNLLSGTYNYAGTITGSAAYTDPALQTQGGAALASNYPTWSGVSISGTVTNATAPYGQTNSAAISSGSSLAGYGLQSSQGDTTAATLLAGTTSANTNLTMKFTAQGSLGGAEFSSPSSVQSSDTLTLGGLHAIGGNGPDGGSTITDTFVLQLSVTTNVNVVGNNYYLGWFDPNYGASGGWVNAIAGNSNAVLPLDYTGTGAFQGSYATYLSTSTGSGGGEGLTLAEQLGAYGYDSTNNDVWAVLDYDSDVEVIPEPGTYAMIFSGFGMLIGFRRLRRRRSKEI